MHPANTLQMLHHQHPDLLQENSGLLAVDKTNELCDQNKCRTAMEELKQKTLSLQEELSQTHEEYASRIKKLEDEMTRLNTENVRVRSVSTSSEHRVEEQRGEISDLLQRLRKCEAKCEHLSVQLKIERSRSAELEMQSKAFYMSSTIATAVEQHLAGLNLKKEEEETKLKRDMSAQSVDNSSMYHCQFQLIVPNNSISSQTDKVSETSAEKVINQRSEVDDSGYAENSNASCEDSTKKDIKVVNQIAALQEQLDNLKQSLGENRDIDFDESILLRRKSCLERPSCSKKDDYRNPPVPDDCDFLIRTNGLNSFKSTNEWCKDYDRSDADYSSCNNCPSIVSNVKDKEKCNSDDENYTIEQDYEKDIFNNKDVPKLDLSGVNESSQDNKTYRKDNDENNACESNHSFHFTKETITKIDGKLVAEPFHEIDKKASIDDFQREKDDYQANNNFAALSNVKKTSSSKIESENFVSTGVDPIELPLDRFKETGVHTDETTLSLLEKNRLEICEQSVRVCTCPESARRGTSMFRSCSGTLRFTTTISNSKFRKCDCADNLSLEMKGVKGSQTYVRQTSTPHGTFVIQGEAILDSMSPITTGYEVSSLTDLPSEREAVSAQTSLGQDKGTLTQSDETPRSTTDYGSLSEGEVPISGRKRLSLGETPLEVNLRRRETSTSEKMEDTLRAISVELSKCRHLLQMQSSRESSRTPQDATCMTESIDIPKPDQNHPNYHPDSRSQKDNRNIDTCDFESNTRNLDLYNRNIRSSETSSRKSGLILRKCDANERVGGISAKCVFTLHVGTVILSDQAVISSRGKALTLTWRFYDQPPSMTHQLAGRVMHFDFSLEYESRLSQNFIDYLKHEEMPIIVCEIDNQEKPFASCLLPLRDALLHTNRRVDMSLALISGTDIKSKTSMNSFTMNDELGVLDVWCMLRVPPSVMGVINDVISQTIASFHHHPSSMERIVDDDHSDFHLDQDLNLRRTSKTRLMESKYSYDSENIYDIMNSKKWRTSSALKQADGLHKKSVTILKKVPQRPTSSQLIGKLSDDNNTLDITILWLALNEECRAMNDPVVKRIYVAFAFLGKAGADMETPSSLPKPRNFMDKCHFNFRKSFTINECDVVVVGQMAHHRQDNTKSPDPKDCIIFSIISEPPEDPLGLESCEDIGYAYLYLGDALSSNGNTYTEVLPIRTPDEAYVCGRLAVRIDGLAVIRACVERTRSSK
ncbi:uncharacterized protein LOC123714044 isoform X3 [Pieris brassicae]|uniref:uncharacterized protein LOC123714044 isoform X3 n=1 Tax=Pieris brassicae TaxID=7116 RepID=UPI001E65F43A|nr:uncharacterized protein LOC123714044 isoform X3 [Pieris brassicae]